MKNIAVITARSGSKALVDKNIKLLAGKPLLAYTIEAAKESGCFDTIMVSTDSEKYAAIARDYGAQVPFLRSEATSSDTAGSWDVVREVICKYKELREVFDSVCLLQPTSPLRTAEDICEGYKLFESKSADAITAITEVDHSPLWCMTLKDDLSLEEFKKQENNDAPRQALDTYYRINGALYIRKITEDGEDTCSKKEYAYKMPRERSVDIDTELDFKFAECLIINNLGKMDEIE